MAWRTLTDEEIAALTGTRIDGDTRLEIGSITASPWFLGEIVRLQNHLRKNGVAAPVVLAGPTPFAQGHATIESFLDTGRLEDTHQPPRQGPSRTWSARKA